jgi:DNA replication protein DnaC
MSNSSVSLWVLDRIASPNSENHTLQPARLSTRTAGALRGLSTILTSQIPIDKWHEVIGDPTYADAILDRLVHNAHRIDLAGDSLRRTRPRSTTKD